MSEVRVAPSPFDAERLLLLSLLCAVEASRHEARRLMSLITARKEAS